MIKLPLRTGICAILLWMGVAIGVARPAAAQFAVQQVVLEDPDNGGTLTPDELTNTFFNAARCTCGSASQVRVRIEVTPEQGNRNGKVNLMSGDTCTDSENRLDNSRCRTHVEDKIEDWDSTQRFLLDVRQVMTVGDQTCTGVGEDRASVAVYADPDSSDNWALNGAAVAIGLDTELPPSPITDTSTAPVCGEGLVTVSFIAPKQGSTSDVDPDVDRYQVLCAEEGPNPGEFNIAPNFGVDPRFVSPAEICPNQSGVTTTSTEAGLVVDQGIESLHPAYVCSESQKSDGALTIKNLKEGVNYRFWVVSIDLAENASEPALLGDAQTCAAEDLWQRYKRSGGQATGCTIHRDETPDWRVFALTAIWGLLVLRTRKCRSRNVCLRKGKR